ncbi:hypothetical protein Q8G47_28725, partial [Klebsiella pneumoniae]|uniref:hypothetical protein n=1 Tax=Klebsiella pneumoniae TaxID=573 RepID=UPI0030136422
EMDMGVTELRVNLRSNPDFVMCGIANPKNGRNPHYNFSLPEGCDEFPDDHRNWTTWKTQTGHCYFFSGERSPNLKAPENEPPPFESLM